MFADIHLPTYIIEFPTQKTLSSNRYLPLSKWSSTKFVTRYDKQTFFKKKSSENFSFQVFHWFKKNLKSCKLICSVKK
jgi:hypothetical protein